MFDKWVEETPATGAASMLFLKTMWKSAGWVVKESGDSITYSAVGDIITHAGSGAGGMANTRAWFRMSNPDGVEYTIQRGTLNYQWRVKVSAAATFNAGSPDATTTPSVTGTDVKELLGAGTDASPTYETWFGTVDGSYRLKAGADSASPYDFWTTGFPSGGGAINHTFMHESLTVTPTDGAPFHTIIGNSDPSDGNLTAENASGSTRSYATVPAVTPTTWEIFPAGITTFGGQQGIPVRLATNPITTGDDLFPIQYARRAAIANPAYKGVGTVFKWDGVQRSTGVTYTVDTVDDRLCLSDGSVPWKGTVAVV